MNLSSLMSQQPSRLLIGLPSGSPIIKYIDMEHLQAVISARKLEQDMEQSPFLIITNVPLNIIEELENYSESNKCRISADLVDRILILELMLLKPHENMCQRFSWLFNCKVENMNMEPYLDLCGTTGVIHGRFSKQPDCSWAPIPPMQRYNPQWPTIVLEVGLTESIEKLAIDAQGWLEAQGSEVRIAITIKIDRRQPKVIIQKWETGSRPHHITRSYRPTAECTQRIEVSPSSAYNGTIGMLRIPFEKVFDRPINPNSPLESDIIFSSGDIRNLAERTWKVQEFM